MADFILKDNEKVSYTVGALDKDGNPANLQPGSTVAVDSDSKDSAVVIPDATAQTGFVASGFIFAGKVLKDGVVITAIATMPDGTSLSVSATGNIVASATAPPATSLVFNFGAPQAQ